MSKNQSSQAEDSPFQLRQELNATRYQKDSAGGHYESYFIRANHPTKPLAFWFRYSIFSPKPGQGIDNSAVMGELWAVVFNRETNRMIAVKEEFPINECVFSYSGLDVSIADSGRLLPGTANGKVNKNGNHISWDLQYTDGQPALRLLPKRLYKGKFPTAKAAVPNPMAVFTGVIEVNGETFVVDNWVGSQNHNWGSRHIDEYAWSQVAGFENEPDAFLECATARVKWGPLQTPWMTTVVLRYDGREIVMSNLWLAFRAKAAFKSFNWQFDTKHKGIRIRGEIEAPLESFIGFNYYKPDGGSSTCLNSKIAKCRLLVTEAGKPERIFETRHRAAFEIFNTDRDLGVLVIA